MLQEWDRLDGQSNPWFDEFGSKGGPNYLSMLILARRPSVDCILPIAFYRVCMHTYEETIIESSELASNDKVPIMRACRAMETRGVTKILDFLWAPHQIDDCQSHRFCTPARLDIWEEIAWERLEVCGVVTHREAKKTFWDELPTVFGLPNWAELETIKAKAFE
ncbi:hypothetical protein B0H11DRAFT_1927116 [Mycena galericulata]|nr:hypothetical protein B0H11DRAFT_1927116 [Mycena galericulata]